MFAGGPGVTTAVGADVASAEPARFVAVTVTVSVEPTSAAAATYFWPVAPAIELQLSPLESHLFHWYEYTAGRVPLQKPFVAVSVLFSTGVPVADGGDVFPGAVSGGGGMTAPYIVSLKVEPVGALAAAKTVTALPLAKTTLK